MKKRFLALIIVSVMLMMCCGCENTPNTETEKSLPGEINDNFARIAGYDELVYDNKTQIVYYLISYHNGYSGYGYMSPYISKKGNFCRYSDGQIVEIVK